MYVHHDFDPPNNGYMDDELAWRISTVNDSLAHAWEAMSDEDNWEIVCDAVSSITARAVALLICCYDSSPGDYPPISHKDISKLYLIVYRVCLYGFTCGLGRGDLEPEVLFTPEFLQPLLDTEADENPYGDLTVNESWSTLALLSHLFIFDGYNFRDEMDMRFEVDVDCPLVYVSTLHCGKKELSDAPPRAIGVSKQGRFAIPMGQWVIGELHEMLDVLIAGLDKHKAGVALDIKRVAVLAEAMGLRASEISSLDSFCWKMVDGRVVLTCRNGRTVTIPEDYEPLFVPRLEALEDDELLIAPWREHGDVGSVISLTHGMGLEMLGGLGELSTQWISALRMRCFYNKISELGLDGAKAFMGLEVGGNVELRWLIDNARTL